MEYDDSTTEGGEERGEGEEEGEEDASLESYFETLRKHARALRDYILENVHTTFADREQLEYLETAGGAMIYGFVKKYVVPKTIVFVNDRNAPGVDPSRYEHNLDALRILLPPDIVKRVGRCGKEVQVRLMDYLSWFVMAVATEDDEAEKPGE